MMIGASVPRSRIGTVVVDAAEARAAKTAINAAKALVINAVFDVRVMVPNS